jgi:hypothetical protein
MSLEPSDSLEILQLVARADTCASEHDADGYVELFTEDALMAGDQGDVHGRGGGGGGVGGGGGGGGRGRR